MVGRGGSENNKTGVLPPTHYYKKKVFVYIKRTNKPRSIQFLQNEGVQRKGREKERERNPGNIPVKV